MLHQRIGSSQCSVCSMDAPDSLYRVCLPNSSQHTCPNNLPELFQKPQALDGPAPFWALPCKTLDNVPPERRLYAFTAQYEGLCPPASTELQCKSPDSLHAWARLNRSQQICTAACLVDGLLTKPRLTHIVSPTGLRQRIGSSRTIV